MKRIHLYILYAAGWVLTIWLLYGIQTQGMGLLAALLIYGPPVFVLYVVSLMLLDIRDDVIDPSRFRAFIKRRQYAIGFFLFSMAVLIVLLFQS